MELDFLYSLQLLRTPFFDKLMVFITHTGDGGLVWIAIALGFCLSKKYRTCGITMLLVLMAGAFIGNVLLKNIIARPRPCWIDQSIILLIDNPKDFSFPSGHTLAAFGAATTVFLFHRWEGTILIVWASLIAFSRLYLFVHFPTDVLAGCVLGVLIAILVTWVTRRLIKNKMNAPFLS